MRHHVRHVLAGKKKKTLQGGSLNQAMIHLKHKEHHIVSFIAGSQRMTLIRLLPLVSAVSENHLQFTRNIETAREQVTVVCLIQSFL